MRKYDFVNLPANIIVRGDFDVSTCQVLISDESQKSLELGRLKIRILRHGGKPTISNFILKVGSVAGNITINVGYDDSNVIFGAQSSGIFDLRLWRNSKISIGQRTTSNGVIIVCDNSEFSCGEDCMFSSQILVQTSDQHGIVDIDKGVIVNDYYKSVALGDHVWLGRQSTLMAGASIGNGSVIGASSTVTSMIPDNTIAVGVPARVIKENHTWSRFPEELDGFSKQYIEDYRYKTQN